jgi:hypothetical protein
LVRDAKVEAVELRRALLLFAIVLALAAVVASLSSSGSSGTRDAAKTAPALPRARPGPAARPRTVTFDSTHAPVTRSLPTGVAGTVVVRVDQPETVELDGLGLVSDASPVTPARLSVLADQPGRHRIRAVGQNGARGRTLGVLAIRPRG